MRSGWAALLLALAACSPMPSPSGRPSDPVASAIPSATEASREPTTVPIAQRINFTFDVENHSRLPVVVSVASDTAATMPGFEPGQRGTVSIALLNPKNGIGVEIQGAECRLLTSSFYPTPIPFTLVVEDGTGPGTVRLLTVAGTSSTPLPLPTNSLVGCGG